MCRIAILEASVSLVFTNPTALPSVYVLDNKSLSNLCCVLFNIILGVESPHKSPKFLITGRPSGWDTALKSGKACL